MSEYAVGNRVRCFGVFENDEIPPKFIDPTEVFFKVKDPAGLITEHTYGDSVLMKDDVGHYHVDVDVDLHGVWFYRFYSTGTGKAADEKNFTVGDSEFD